MPSLPQHPPLAHDTTSAQTGLDIDTSRSSQSQSSQDGSSSPIAPQYSPITPKAVPVLPATTVPLPGQALEDENRSRQPARDNMSTARQSPKRDDKHIANAPGGAHPPTMNPPPEVDGSTAPSTQFIPQPPLQPFSGQDASDAIALRAAISTLQLQKKKAQDDLKTLERIKNQALDDPDHFKTELAAGRLKERPREVPDIQSILDDDSDDDDEDVVFVTRDEQNEESTAAQNGHDPNSARKPFPRIPGPQDVVRMPHVNWDKYGIVGEPLDRMHEQQRRWPGQTPWSANRGREHSVAAPYSPFLDQLDPSQAGSGASGPRKDSGMTVAATPTTAISEHPMSTRSRT